MHQERFLQREIETQQVHQESCVTKKGWGGARIRKMSHHCHSWDYWRSNTKEKNLVSGELRGLREKGVTAREETVRLYSELQSERKTGRMEKSDTVGHVIPAL